MSPVFDIAPLSVLKHLFRTSIIACCMLAGVPTAWSQLTEGSVILSEFFEELHRVDVNSGAVTDILDNSVGNSVSIGNVVGLDSSTVILSEFNDLFRYDVATETSSFFTTLPSQLTPSEVTRDLNGNLIAVNATGVYRIDGATGNTNLVHEETFFSPGDAVVDLNGNIFVTEFFDGLGVVNPNGGFTQIGDFSANEFSNIDIGIDGQLYLASTFGGEFWRVDPVTGEGTLLGANLFSSVLDDLQIVANGDLLFSATVDSQDGLFLFDPDTAAISTVFLSDDLNNGFFSPSDLDVFETQFRSTNFVAIPEPGSAGLIGLVLVGISARRRRQ